MLSLKAISNLPLMAGCRHHIPASSVALTRIVSMHTPSCPSHFHTTARQDGPILERQPRATYYPPLNRRWLSTHPICDHIDGNIAKDISPEEFDNAYKFIYYQHNHPRGPWLKTLQTAQKLLQGHNPRILVIGSGPGEPAATLATNFQGADVISAHSTTKCKEWASQHFRKHSLLNVTARLVPSMADLDMFADGSFDLVASVYGLAHAEDPQVAINEIHRVLKPGGSFLVSVWVNVPADPASDIILRHSCVGPNPWHKGEDKRDVVGDFACPLRSKRPMSLSKPHLLENMLEKANLPVVESSNDEYPLKLGKTKDFAFKALTLPIRTELQQLKKDNHYHHQDAGEAFEDVLKEGFMVKQREDGEMEVPYNIYKFLVARREFEDDDIAKETKALVRRSTHGQSSVKKATTVNPIDVKQDPVVFDTWNRMKAAVSEKIVNAVTKQIDGFKHDSLVKILDAAPTAFAPTLFNIARSHPHAAVTATSKSISVVEGIREEAVKCGLSNMKVKALDSSQMGPFADKSFDVVICSFGLTFLDSPSDTLKEFHRLLKPGGSLIVSVWEEFSLQQLADSIVNTMHAEGSVEDFLNLDTSAMGVLNQLTPYATPHEIENMISDSGFNLTHVNHETARIILAEANCKSDVGFNISTLAIRPFLQEMEKKGIIKNAFEEAKKAFESLLRDPSLVSRDKCGNLVTKLPSRFKLVSATKPFADIGFLDKKKMSPERTVIHVRDIPK